MSMLANALGLFLAVGDAGSDKAPNSFLCTVFPLFCRRR